MVRAGDDNLVEATMHARKHLTGASQMPFGLSYAALLSYNPDTDYEPVSASTF
jgi:hypothetical protein